MTKQVARKTKLQMASVRVPDGSMQVAADDASYWLLRHAAPALLSVEDPATTTPVPGTVDKLLEHSMALRRGVKGSRSATATAEGVRYARAKIKIGVQRAANTLHEMGRPVNFLKRHGSLQGFLDAQYPTLVDVAAVARDRGPWSSGGVAEETYRLCVAVICRSHLVAQLTGHPTAHLRMAYGRAIRELHMWGRIACVPATPEDAA